MKKFISVFTFLFLATGLFALDTNELNQYLQKVYKAYNIPGMAFCITDSEKLLMTATYGQCTDVNQQFFIGSESKSFTALGIMQLAEKELINLDEDISVYLPQYSFSKKVTVRNLLNQTSGFGTYMKLADFNITKSYGKHVYSNVNYDLLGKIIESVSHLSYEDYMRENIFEPLNMKSSIANAQKVKTSSRLLKGNRNYFGFFFQGNADYPSEKSWFREPAGFIATSPEDTCNYLRMYLNYGKNSQNVQIVQPASIKSMWYDNVSVSEKSTVRYGMGWNYDKIDGLEVVSHGGQVENYISYMFLLPEKNLAVNFNINGNDHLCMNMLMGNVIPNIISIINGKSAEEVKETSYFLIHLLLNVIYLLIAGVSILFLFRAIKKNNCGRKKDIIIMTVYVIWIVFLLIILPACAATPLWVVKSYVPDLFFVILSSAVVTFAAFCIKVKKSLIWKKLFFVNNFGT